MENTRRVKIWQEQITIPTYRVSAPETSPIFIENRAYQGSTGKVYPLPVTEKIADVKEDVSYRAIYLENDYLQVMILPELGGRIQRALDKTNGYDFVYYNHVIKPALVGLLGPWISGGIEFNWPQHHRPSTFMPVDYHMQENDDGSCSLYVGETDKMYGTKGMARFTLYPDKAYIEIHGRLYNPTDLAQTFLWWANPAVPVNENTFSVFPPDVTAVLDHGKRAVSTFPLATGEYYKADYSAGVDISMYKNVKVPTSYMAAHSDYDFIGNYDAGVEAGLLHVADHHVSPGKKQWTWGNADFGRAWDRNLTDEDGPYIELMTGVFTDNQPDFTWLKPHEEKTFSQYFMPYKGVGRIDNATKDMAVSLSVEQGHGQLRAYASGEFAGASVHVLGGEDTLLDQRADFTPKAMQTFAFEAGSLRASDLTVTITAASGRELIRCAPREAELLPIPAPAEPLPVPAQVKSCEELYLSGQHLEQYRHATREPADYYTEGLRRDPGDIRLNNAYGLLLLRRGDFTKAKECFERAIQRQTWKNPNPYHGECYFNLGLSCLLLGEEEAAYDAFYKATWSHETQGTGFYHLACLASRKGLYEQALDFLEASLPHNWHDMKARGLKAALLRKLGLDNAQWLAQGLAIDPLDMALRYEDARRTGAMDAWQSIMRDDSFLPVALAYMHAGLYEDALDILSHGPAGFPLTQYYRGYALARMGNEAASMDAYRQAEACSPDYCFPSKMEEIVILQEAMAKLPKAPRAKHYLADLLYDKKQRRSAIALWEESLAEEPDWALTMRNLAIAYYNSEKDSAKAMIMMRRAWEQDGKSSRFLLEYDQLCARTGVPYAERLALLQMHEPLIKSRDALYLELITLLNIAGRYEEALHRLLTHTFHPWEGGEGRVSGQYRYALTQLALKQIADGAHEAALSLLQRTLTYPHNLGEGKLPNVQDTMAYYHMGRACRALGRTDDARHYFEKASVGIDEPAIALYYNEQPSDTIYYQGLANEALGNTNAARRCFHQLINFGRRHLFDRVEYDFFAVSLPELDVFPADIALTHEIYCRYLMGLGELGFHHYTKARTMFEAVLKLQPHHQGALYHRSLLPPL